MPKMDRRIQRTRELLQKALIELIDERGYDAITIQDVVDRANIGRTTFYKHYNSKDDLFMSCHEAIVSSFQFERLYMHPLSREELLEREAPPKMILAFQHLEETRARLSPIFQGKDGPTILKQIRDRSAKEIEANLRAIMQKADDSIPLNILAGYLAGAQLALVLWWLEKRRSHTPKDIVQALHRLQRAAIQDVLGRDS
jgi:AcrR family transcriptional regulator